LVVWKLASEDLPGTAIFPQTEEEISVERIILGSVLI
jgi:hypothetical protein